MVSFLTIPTSEERPQLPILSSFLPRSVERDGRVIISPERFVARFSPEELNGDDRALTDARRRRQLIGMCEACLHGEHEICSRALCPCIHKRQR